MLTRMLLRPRWLAVPPLLLLSFGAFASCAIDHASEIALDIHAPEGVLGQASDVTLTVFDAKGFTCDAMGNVTPNPTNPSTFNLMPDQTPPTTWSGKLTLPEDGSTKMFAVAVRQGMVPLANGCTTAKINQDPLNVSIKVVRYVPPACCNNGTLETGELCDTGMTAGAACSSITPTEACAADCTTNEIPVDRMPTGNAPTGTSQLALAFAPGSGQLSNGLRAAYTDNSPTSNSGDVDVRELTSEVTSVTLPALLTGPLRLPLRCANPGGVGQARTQKSPAVAALTGGNVAVAYLSDELVPGQFNIFTTVLDGTGCVPAMLNPPTMFNPVQANTSSGGADTPAIAATSNGQALVVWTEGGAMMGRIFDGTMFTFPGAVIPLGMGATPRVAATKNGFVVAYAGAGPGDSDGVFYETVSATGQVGTPVLVNAKTSGVQDQPAVAAFSDGRFAVAFRSGGDIFLQRYDASSTAISGDQDAAFDTTNPGGQSSPALASGNSPTQGDFFVAAWATSSGDIAARLAGAGGGFLFNQVNGQNSDFVASRPGEAGMRARPVVVVANYIVFGWEDTSGSNPGVFVRRFPLPQ